MAGISALITKGIGTFTSVPLFLLKGLTQASEGPQVTPDAVITLEASYEPTLGYEASYTRTLTLKGSLG